MNRSPNGFPVPLVSAFIILLAPNLFSAVLSPDLGLKIRILGLGFAVGLILLPALLFPTRWLLWGSLPLAVMAPFESFHIVMMGAPSTPGMIGSLLETNPREAFELGAVAWGALLLALMVPALQFMLNRLKRFRPAAPLPRPWLRGISILVVLAFALETVHILRLPIEGRWQRMAAGEEFKRTFPFGLLWKASTVIERKIRLSTRRLRTRQFAWNAITPTPDSTSETYVVIVGEASRAGSWSIYGYGRPTTPLTASDSSLLVFLNVTSGSNLTFEAVAQLFSLATPQNPDIFESSSSMVSGFRQAGFSTWWLSLQSPFGLADGKPTMIAREADVCRFLSTDFADSETSPYDSALLPLLDQALDSRARKKLVVLHTLGSHFRYDMRYPSTFARFRNPDSSGEVERAEYDNSVAYTDWFVDQVKQRLRARSGLRALAFVSDHGEALGEAGLRRHANAVPARTEVEVPFFMWISPEVEAERPWLVPALRAHLRAKVNTSDFAPTWLEIAGIRSDRTDSTRNLARSSYQERRRWVLSASGGLLDADLLAGSSLPPDHPQTPQVSEP